METLTALTAATTRTQVYAVAKAAGVTITTENKKQLNLGGLKDFVRKAIRPTRHTYIAYSPIRPEFAAADKAQRDMIQSRASFALAPYGSDLARLERSLEADKARFNDAFTVVIELGLLADYSAWATFCKQAREAA